MAVVLFCPLVTAQSSDPVHLSPPEPTAQPASTPVSVLVYGEKSSPMLYAEMQPLRINVDLVLVPVTITDSMNRPVTGLKKQDFALFEGNEPQQIRYFSMEDTPISVGVLLDLSKSMTDKIDTAREAVSDFFETANPLDEYFVISFADRPELLADATRSTGEIQGKLAGATPGGHTALLDAIYMGIAKTRRARYRRRALLIISDGGDNRSRYRAGEVRRLVQEADVEIYAIGIFDSIFKTPEEWMGKRLLTEITEATGGRTITLNNARELPEVARTISLELRNQYVLGYSPSNAARDGKWRKIKVRVTPSAGSTPFQVYSRGGYLAPSR